MGVRYHNMRSTYQPVPAAYQTDGDEGYFLNMQTLTESLSSPASPSQKSTRWVAVGLVSLAVVSAVAIVAFFVHSPEAASAPKDYQNYIKSAQLVPDDSFDVRAAEDAISRFLNPQNSSTSSFAFFRGIAANLVALETSWSLITSEIKTFVDVISTQIGFTEDEKVMAAEQLALAMRSVLTKAFGENKPEGSLVKRVVEFTYNMALKIRQVVRYLREHPVETSLTSFEAKLREIELILTSELQRAGAVTDNKIHYTEFEEMLGRCFDTVMMG
eukprot:c11401_g1_i1.p1 GENE.c11401_g1_i1~~c11401_g1_i1.p1  ORF type:complete len:272 (-),score=60.56 c11401_g1_i1:308-1123(-)